MNDIITQELKKQGAEVIRFVDISSLSIEQDFGYPNAVLFGMSLSKQFVLDPSDIPTDDDYLKKEHDVELLADLIAEFIINQGYRAHSQSERANLENGFIESEYYPPGAEQGISILPQKAIARLAGLGFIGKNNLLVTKEYGCALVICSVLTDAPIETENYPVIESKCGDCTACVDICPGKALTGKAWTQDGKRESVVDVSKCMCALKCMMICPWTLRYARKTY